MSACSRSGRARAHTRCVGITHTISRQAKDAALTLTHARTHTHTHDCKTIGHNSGSECQNPRQLDRQTRQGMFAANRHLSAVTGTGREGLASWGMHRVQDEVLGGLWQLHCTRSLCRTYDDEHTHTHIYFCEAQHNSCGWVCSAVSLIAEQVEGSGTAVMTTIRRPGLRPASGPCPAAVAARPHGWGWAISTDFCHSTETRPPLASLGAP